MRRREMLGALGAGAAAFSAATAHADDKPKAHDHSAMMTKAHTDCLDACGDCAKTCDMTFHHCVMEVAAGKGEHAKALQLLTDCAGFCALSACMIAKSSPLMGYSCMACAEACKATIVEVSKFDQPEMKKAVVALKRCEDSCVAMNQAMGHDHKAGGTTKSARQ